MVTPPKRFTSPLRSELEAKHWGKYITINPVTGDYAIGRTLDASLHKMRQKYPGVAFFTIRIGYQAAVHFGGTGASDGKRPKGVRHDQRQN